MILELQTNRREIDNEPAAGSAGQIGQIIFFPQLFENLLPRKIGLNINTAIECYQFTIVNHTIQFPM